MVDVMGLFRSFVKYRIYNDFGKKRGNKKYVQILLGQEGHGRRLQECKHIVSKKARLFF